jgi:type IV secretion system protein VirB10
MMASRTPPIDPRIATWSAEDEGTEAGVRPVVARPRSLFSGAAFAAVMVIAAIVLFLILDSRRRSQLEPAVKVRGAEAAGVTAPAPPPLYVPPTMALPGTAFVPAPVETLPARPQQVYTPAPYVPPPPPEIRYVPQPIDPASNLPPPPQRVSNSPTVVIDNTAPRAGPAVEGPQQPGSDGQPGLGSMLAGGSSNAGRVRSSVFANRSTTVALGTLMPAVLETAFDSRRPGFARAVVSRDVRGFDGTRVLVPRGSRLTGEYRSDIQPGQKRALINWTRLIRPDGVTIALASPAGDTLGRGGVRGKYNSHFIERFGGAILQSVLQVGVNAASRAASGNVILALPGSTQNTPQLMDSARIVPTLTVPAGTSISVFVARDLDFSSADKLP